MGRLISEIVEGRNNLAVASPKRRQVIEVMDPGKNPLMVEEVTQKGKM